MVPGCHGDDAFCCLVAVGLAALTRTHLHCRAHASINIVLTVVLAITGLCQWARGQQRFRNYPWLRHRSIAWIHRSAGLFYVLLIVFWDLLFETENASTAENAILEALNKPLLAVLVLTALFLCKRSANRTLAPSMTAC